MGGGAGLVSVKSCRLAFISVSAGRPKTGREKKSAIVGKIKNWSCILTN
jgi:hypothetical protein